MAHTNDAEWTAPHPALPSSPEFYRRALDHLPSGVVVVDAGGVVLYVNQTLLELGGLFAGNVVGTSVLEYVHNDDRDALTDTFRGIAASPDARVLGSAKPWAEIYFRLVLPDGEVLPIELLGAGGLLDPAVGGIIFVVRPARHRNLLAQVLDGLSQGSSIHQLLRLVIDFVVSPPLDIDAVILQSTSDGDYMVGASSFPRLTELAGSSAARQMVWPEAPGPVAMPVADLPAELAQLFRDIDHHHLWHVTVESTLSPTTLRIIACSRTLPIPDRGVIDRLMQARELAATVLLRSQSDQLLTHVAGHDRLTKLPNRVAFHDVASRLDPERSRAAIHLDLDGLKRVNAALGLGAGDAVLQIVTDRMRAVSGGQGMIGRVGDDEFTIVVSHTTEEESFEQRAADLAVGIQAAISEPFFIAGRPIRISASIGLAIGTGEVGIDELLATAMSAMQASKSRGGNKITRSETI